LEIAISNTSIATVNSAETVTAFFRLLPAAVLRRCRPVRVVEPPRTRNWLTKRASAAPDPLRTLTTGGFPVSEPQSLRPIV